MPTNRDLNRSYTKFQIFDLEKYGEDERGYLLSLYSQDGTFAEFVEDRISVSNFNVLRGLHGDAYTDKLFFLLEGKCYFFATPYDRRHPQYGQKFFYKLDSNYPQAIYVPRGFINGHATITKCTLLYKWSRAYAGPEGQVTVDPHDPELGIDWYKDLEKIPYIMSKRDQNGKPFSKIVYSF